jgi:hypothetical protein
MGMGFGSDDIVDRLEAAAGDAEGEDVVPLAELFPGMFMHRYTTFDSIEAFFEASPVALTDERDVTELAGSDLDAFVREHTSFEDWAEMLETAGEVWHARQRGF